MYACESNSEVKNSFIGHFGLHKVGVTAVLHKLYGSIGLIIINFSYQSHTAAVTPISSIDRFDQAYNTISAALNYMQMGRDIYYVNVTGIQLNI